MTYPKVVKAAAQQTLDAAPQRQKALDGALASREVLRVEQARRDQAALDRDVAKARDDIERYRREETSIIGLEKPLFELRNPGLISVPLGFLAVIIGSLLYRDPRALALWDEVSVRQNTGILAARGGGQ